MDIVKFMIVVIMYLNGIDRINNYNMLDFLKVYNQVVISEGYKDVRNRITPILTSKIPNFDPNLIKMMFMKHQKNKDKIPEEYRNIDVYFSKQFDNDIVNRYNDLVSKLDKIPDIQITKGEAKRSLYESLKLTENDEYILFKVPSHEDAVKLVRPGNNAPEGCDWPAMLPVSWCIAADSKDGQEVWEVYSDKSNDDFESTHVAKFNDKGIYVAFGDKGNFYFAFRKHPLLDQEIKDKNTQNKIYKVNPTDFLAILIYQSGKIEITQSPNSPPEPLLNTWPSVLPSNWRSLCVPPPGEPDIDFIPYDDHYEMYGDRWVHAIIQFPQLAKYCDEYNGWKEFINEDWRHILRSFPQFVNKCAEYNVWENFKGYDWAVMLKDQPQFVKYCDKYNGWKRFDDDHWKLLLDKQPQFKNIAKKYGYN